MKTGRDEFLRVWFSRAGQRSSVSLDVYLASLLEETLGGEEAMRQWVQKTVDRLEWEKTQARPGLSRIVQREAIRCVLERRSGGLPS